MTRVQRSAAARSGLLERALRVVTWQERLRKLRDVFSRWRETVWRGRRALRRDLNVLSFRVATQQRRRSLVKVAMEAWRAALAFFSPPQDFTLPTMRDLNVLSFRVATLLRRRDLAKVALEAWRSARTFFSPPPGLTLPLSSSGARVFSL